VLSEKLTKILFTHIKHFLPDILREIVFKLKECEERMRDLGPSAPVDPREKT
jgi:dynamin 1-like protein